MTPMTEEQWLECTEPYAMIVLLWMKPLSRVQRFLLVMGVKRLSWEARKWLLFNCACCRRYWSRVKSRKRRAAVQLVENVADAYTEAYKEAATWTERTARMIMARERPGCCELLREIFGNPFRQVRFHAKWLTADVASIAGAIYRSNDFACMPILADALEDTGCTDADILTHCRQPGEHVRGCWVVDLLLAKR